MSELEDTMELEGTVDELPVPTDPVPLIVPEPVGPPLRVTFLLVVEKLRLIPVGCKVKLEMEPLKPPLDVGMIEGPVGCKVKLVTEELLPPLEVGTTDDEAADVGQVKKLEKLGAVSSVRTNFLRLLTLSFRW